MSRGERERHPGLRQGEAASNCYGFLCFAVTLYNIRGCGICHRPADFSAAFNAFGLAVGVKSQGLIPVP